MKKIYFLAALLLTAILIFNTASAQTYTATRTGNWSAANTWDVNGRPSANCNGCTITINSGITVTLDVSVLLRGGSNLIIGTTSAAATLIIPASDASSTAVITAAHNRIVLYNDGTTPTLNKVTLQNANSVVDATNAAKFDGVFGFAGTILGGAQPYLNGTFSKFVGNAPRGMQLNLPPNDYVVSDATAPNRNLLSGPTTILSSDGTLPIILSNFDASLNNGIVDVSWTTTQEINSDHFNVQHSTTGAGFETIGVVTAKGFSSLAVDYSYADKTPATGANYYRLQSVDKDGKFTYSDVKVVYGSPLASARVFPNPAKDVVNVTLAAKSNITAIRLVDLSGNVLQTRKLTNAAGTTQTFSVSTLSKGQYMLEMIAANGKKATTPVLIAR